MISENYTWMLERNGRIEPSSDSFFAMKGAASDEGCARPSQRASVAFEYPESGIPRRFVASAFILLFITPLLSGPSNPATLAPAEQLIAELACAVCHSGLPEQTDIKDYAPELSDAGRRFNPAYLFSYLQNPTRVRPYVWPTRMPDFGLSPRETLALVLFLETQREEKLTKRESPAAVEASRDGEVAAGRALIAGYECLKCHVLEKDGQNESVDLTSVGFRLNANWVKRYLVSPSRFDGTESGMPSFFYSWNASQDAFVEFLPEAADDIHSMTAFLFDIAGEKRERLQKAYLETKAANPGITAEMGEKIFISQNCAACHKTSFVRATAWKNAPDLGLESERVKETWLRSYLKKPVAIRPFGYYPGTGSRMPDFKLSEKEVDILTGYLFRSQSIHDAAAPGPAVKKLSAFSILKAEKFLQDKLSCLGCHKLGDEGGRIAPNLANVRNRLQGSYIRKIVRDPQALDRHSIMPKVQMPPKRLSLITDYLTYAEQAGVADTYLSLVEHPVHFYEKTSAATELFSRYCAACHGPEGGGDGFNARYLPKEPIKHSDAEYMSTRPDDTLFDGIFAGGAILNKSHMMPAWGATLKAEEILTLVRHLRDLCQCRGPAWSEDNK